MKKSLFAVAFGSLALVSCSSDDVSTAQEPDYTGKSILEIETVVDGLTKSNVEGIMAGGTPWEDGDRIRIFALDYDKYMADGFVVKYTGADFMNKGFQYLADSRTWQHVDNQPILLSNLKARLYAFSPSFGELTDGFNYNGDGALNPKRIPLTFNTPNKIDFLYGTHRNTADGQTDQSGDNMTDGGGSQNDNGAMFSYVDNKNPLVRLYMKHAQTCVRIRLAKEAVNPDKLYTGKGQVTALEVMQLKKTTSSYGNTVYEPADNAQTHGAALPANGYIDITKTEDNITPLEWKVATMTDLIDGVDKKDFILNPTLGNGAAPQYNEAFALLAPCKEDMVRGFHLLVDDVHFYVPCSTDEKPKEWKAGFTYTYDLVLTGKSLEMSSGEDGDVVTVKPWNDGGTYPGEF
jgi:hypothetical protein